MQITKSTQPLKVEEVKRRWILLDAKGQILGRFASEVSKLLIGKGKVKYSNHVDSGDNVVVINSREIVVTGKKMREKEYKYYSGYPGGLRVFKMEDLLKRKPTEVLRHAVAGMLPKNKLRNLRIKRLHIFPGADHSFTDKLN